MSEGSRSPADDEVFAFPASFAQQRLWFLDQVDPGIAAYNVVQGLRLDGPLDADALAASVREVVRRHESLRTTFASQEGAPLQVVSPDPRIDWAVADVQDRPEARRLPEAERLANADARRPFDLTKGPLVRGLLVVVGPTTHVLVLTVHHIVCDGWSLALLFEELSALYPALAAGQASPLPEPAVQYPDYALWQREWFQGDELERQLSFWRQALAGTLSVLELPGDRGRPPLQSFLGGTLRFFVGPELTRALGALARHEGLSPFMLLLAAWNVLLRRLSGQDEILVGTPIANRDRPEIERSIGFYTNTVVFRTDLSGAPSFRGLCKRIGAGALGVFAHQDVPLEKVVEAIHPARGTSWNPVFQVMFGLQRAPESALVLPGVHASPIDVNSGTSKFDVTLDMQELGDDRGMQGLFEYSLDLFDDTTAARIARQFHTLLASIAADPDRPITALPLLDADDRRRVLVDWNATAMPLPEPHCVHQLVSAQAARTPDAIAVEGDTKDATLTYAALEARSSALGAHLRGLGVGPNMLVGVHLDRSPDMLVALLGVLKAGGAYLPLDPAYPRDRIGYMLSDAGARVVVTQRSTVEALPDTDATLVVLDGAWTDGTDATATVAPDSGVTGLDLAYVIYTSGSTGKPKGVPIPHRAFANFLRSMQREPGLTAADRLLAVTTLSFDIAGLELFLPLTVGGTVIIAGRDTVTDGAALLARLHSSRATVLQATPATFRMLLEAGWEPAADQSPRPKILCGGEALPKPLVAPLIERASALWNMYGPTETTIWSTCCAITDADNISIGRPIANTQLYILDQHHEPVPVGVVGDLYIGGLGLARGYWQRPELTADRFVPNPFVLDDPGARMYRTGDLARHRADGTVDFLGRGDTQVKLRGFRIELGEIEAALAHHERVRQAVVVVRADGAGDQRLVAYVVHQDSSLAPTASELRKFLRVSLPDHMIPHLFVELGKVPLTNNGKVDRQALPDPFQQERRTVAEQSAPRTSMEQTVAEIWREVLKVDVGRHDNFFDLGGHSLMSMQVIHRIIARTGHRINPRSMVFQNLEQIAAECEAAVPQ